LRPAGAGVGEGRAKRFLLRLEAGLLALLAACQAETPPQVQPEADKAEHFHAVIGGTPLHLALEDCEVFFVAPGDKREKVLATDFYPMPSVCKVQKAAADADYITVELGRQAFGAGGCCATEGIWRSRDGKTWERRRAGKWVPHKP